MRARKISNTPLKQARIYGAFIKMNFYSLIKDAWAIPLLLRRCTCAFIAYTTIHAVGCGWCKAPSTISKKMHTRLDRIDKSLFEHAFSERMSKRTKSGTILFWFLVQIVDPPESFAIFLPRTGFKNVFPVPFDLPKDKIKKPGIYGTVMARRMLLENDKQSGCIILSCVV